MTVQKVSKYQTSDGKLWDDEGEARKHENYINALSDLNDLLKSSVSTGRLDAVLKHLLLEEELVRDVLVRYHKRLPKTEKAAA